MVRIRALGQLGWARGAVGAAIAIGLSGVVTWLVLGESVGMLPFLVAPLGASAVLVFCVPASPLAQPWSVIGGNLLSASIGLAAGHYIGNPWLAASLAVGTAIAVMSLARCLHPPGGACALLCSLGALANKPWDWMWMGPITANVLTLCLVGWAYNNLTGHSWPHRPPLVPPIAPKAQYSREEIETLLAEWDEDLDIEVDDLHAFVKALLQRSKPA